ncbi:hypothetical protein PROP_03422 [Propionicimonas sp. T2.31MG-18]|uniref:leucine-rich repeat domain-containing protein n=1 Tax=Propionicimonas sp. T2.31MG-18 TaxID=3157620 RepID=UPI0035E8923E
MKARALCALASVLALGISGLGAAPARADDTAAVPDASFRHCLQRNLNLQELPPELTAENLARLRLVSCWEYGDGVIRDVTGAELLTGTTVLFLESTALTDLAPITGLGAVEQFVIQTSEPVDLSPIATLPKLWALGLKLPEVSDIGIVRHLPQLRAIQLRLDPSTSLAPLADLPLLDQVLLESGFTDLSVLDGLPALDLLHVRVDGATPAGLHLPASVARLDLSGPHLERLDGIPAGSSVKNVDIRAAGLTSLSGIGALEDVTHLNVRSAQITDLAGLASLSELESLDLGENAITDLSALASLEKLKNLQLAGNEITDISPLTGLHALTTLDLSRNPVADLRPLRGLSGLATLALDETGVTDVSPLGEVPHLASLSATGNHLADLGSPGTLAHLTVARLSSNGLRSIEGLRGARLTSVALHRNEIEDVGPLASVAGGAGVGLDFNHVRDLSPLPDTALVHAAWQTLTHPAATVGVPSDLGLRDVRGEKLCPTFTPAAPCTDGAATFPLSGTYRGAVQVNDSSQTFSASYTVAAGPDREFSRTYTPTVGGVPTVGLSVGAQVREWSPKVDHFTYRWYRDGTAIPGDAATSYYYNAVGADRGAHLSVCVTGHLDGYADTTRCSSRTRATLTGWISFPARPKVAGPAATDATLTAVASTYNKEVRLTYQWQRNRKDIKGATAATYTVTSSDVGDELRVKVRGTASGYYAHTEYSKSVTVHKALLLPVVPTVSGDAKAGSTLTADPGAWGPAPVNLAYQWYADGRVLARQTGRTHVVSSAELGKTITVTVTATKRGYYTSRRTSVPTAAVVAA